MQEFQGWTPTVIDNLTIDQLNVIFEEINKYRKKIPPVDISVESIRRVIFKYLGVKELVDSEDEDIKFNGVPVVKGTDEELKAWYKTKMKEPFSKFKSKYRRKK